MKYYIRYVHETLNQGMDRVDIVEVNHPYELRKAIKKKLDGAPGYELEGIYTWDKLKLEHPKWAEIIEWKNNKCQKA